MIQVDIQQENKDLVPQQSVGLEQGPEGTWRQILPQSLQEPTYSSNTWISTCETLGREPRNVHLLWDNKWVAF